MEYRVVHVSGRTRQNHLHGIRTLFLLLRDRHSILQIICSYTSSYRLLFKV